MNGKSDNKAAIRARSADPSSSAAIRQVYQTPQLIETVRLRAIVHQFPSEPPPPGREPSGF